MALVMAAPLLGGAARDTYSLIVYRRRMYGHDAINPELHSLTPLPRSQRLR